MISIPVLDHSLLLIISKFLNGFFARLVGPNAYRFFDRIHENLSITDLAGFGSFNDCVGRVLHHAVAEHHLYLDLWQKVDRVFTSAINLRMTFLPSKSFNFGNRHSLDSEVG